MFIDKQLLSFKEISLKNICHKNKKTWKHGKMIHLNKF